MTTDDLSRAKKYIHNGHVKKAEWVLNQFLRQNPNSEDALLLLVDCTDSIDQKLKHLRRILEINPRNIAAKQYVKSLSSSQGTDNNATSANEKDQKRTKRRSQAKRETISDSAGKEAASTKKKPNVKQPRVKNPVRAKKSDPASEQGGEKPRRGRPKSKKEETAELADAGKKSSKVKKPRNKKEKKQELQEITPPPPERVRRSPEDNFFYGFREGIDVSARIETGMFGKTVVVDGIRISQYDGPPCFYLDEAKIFTQCNTCTYFSRRNCLLRHDEFLLEDIRRFTEIRIERAEVLERKRRVITRTIQKELKAHGRPLHYTVIAKIIMGRYPKYRLNAHRVYHYLRWHPELFERVDAGVYRAK